VNTSVRFAVIALMCANLAGCALAALYFLGGGAAVAGVAGGGLLVGLAATMPERAAMERCREFTGDGLVATEWLDAAIPTDEGQVLIFEANWRPEFANEGYPQSERRENATTDGALIIGERSVTVVPPQPTVGVRIPYEAVLNIELQNSSAIGQPYIIIVKSVCGRFDIFSFVRRQGAIKLDPEATVMAAAQIKARVAAVKSTAEKGP
jgi:hypothetical protein